MSDDKDQRGPQDASRISLSEAYEVEYWTKALGVSRDDLAKAVAEVGNGADAVRAYLQRGAH